MATRGSTATKASFASAATSIEGLDSPSDVLDFARWCRSEADRFEANLMLAAVAWAEQHPPESIDTAATWSSPAGDTGLLLAGPGAPLVCEFSIAEFALAIGRSTDSGRAYLATAIELKYRLPRTWGRVLRGDLPAWRARRIAEATIALTLEAAAFVTLRSRRSRTRSATPRWSDWSKKRSTGSCPTSPAKTRKRPPMGAT